MQTLVNQMFNVGYETMGQLSIRGVAAAAVPAPGLATGTADATAAGATAESASGTGSSLVAGAGNSPPSQHGGPPSSAPSASVAPVARDAAPERSEEELRSAFKQLLSDSLEAQAQSQGSVDPAADSQPRGAGPSLPPRPAAVAAGPPAVAAAVGGVGPAGAARAQLQRDLDSLPSHMLARERQRLRMADPGADALPRHHSVFVRYHGDQHVCDAREQTKCARQVGFGAKRKRRHPWFKPVISGLLGVGVGVLGAGLATGNVRWRWLSGALKGKKSSRLKPQGVKKGTSSKKKY